MSLRTRFARIAAPALALAALSPLLMPMPARAQAASGVKVSVLHAANYPSALTIGPDGSFFGTEESNLGSLFKVTLGGLFHPLITFNGSNGAGPPQGALLALPDGSFFGSTEEGGSSNTGVLFQFTPTRRYQIKHEFGKISGNKRTNSLGAFPSLPMVLGSDGAVYGVTGNGGSTGAGVIFRYTAARGVEVVHTIPYNANSFAGLSLGPDGALYGTSDYSGPNAVGQIFRCTTTGDFSILHTFAVSDGGYPNGVPVAGPDGALYGTTSSNGPGSDAAGVVYRITTGGDFSLLHTFRRGDAIYQPNSPLAVGPDGKFYGFTVTGSTGQGGVYRITADGTLTLLYRNPASAHDIGGNGTAPIFGRDNRLYISGNDAIYKITVPF